MTLLTLFSSPKPFTDPHIATIQRNAIASWTHLPDVDVILLGDEEGLAEAARDLGVLHLPKVELNENGTPLISSMFALARENSESPLLGIINTDILLMNEIVGASQRIVSRFEKFVLMGQRWDLDVTQPMEFSEDWQSRLKKNIQKEGQLHRPAGSDYFIFPRACYMDIPDFAIGRAGWDNWMIFKARAEKWTTIDATPDVMIVHQNHDYRHLPTGEIHYNLPETDENMQMAGGAAVTRYTIKDTKRQLRDGKITRPRLTSGRFWRGVEQFLRKLFFFLKEEKVEKVVRPKRWAKIFKKIIGK
ncbi:MAG: hypothetical protein ISR59_00370 [Anaerolineales bacterium]|uniref:Glycosyltransferase family 2 protein n=1 Tax=Candidatus Desulfolinea nitratireducens TaxID=2841698 RepID=A0A8J6NN13_9CHLR|nr:hypothetical protein [Candidatus Desulfolinea nitratireducens]MBL6959533.1 hypothetical protein [Anaerolineales bacterium]